MNLLKYKLPNIRKKRITIIKDDNNKLDELKLSIYNIQNKFKISKTPAKLRHINYINDSQTNRNNSNINDENYLIKSLLYKNIDCKKYLKPIKNLSKSTSATNVQKNSQNFFISEEHKTKNNNLTDLIFKKFQKNFNKPNINKITNINKYLLKKNENDTNGNFIFNDYDEEIKETITFILNNNNSKEIFKKQLTKKFPENEIKKIYNNNKHIDNFRFIGKRFNSPALKNIRDIKYLQEIIHYRNNSNNDENEKKQVLEIDKYNSFLKGKIKHIENQINYAGKNLSEMNKQLHSCLINARNQFDLDTKNIFGEKYI